MPNIKPILEPKKYYHIYNRGINSCNLFREDTNYEHFLRLYEKYIDPVADTFAWVLMKNHFHLLVRINPEDEIFKNLKNLEGFENLRGLKSEKRIYQQFSNLFNAYTKAFNKKYKRTGSLFESNFRRKLINDESYFENIVIYIHNNPVHHGFCEHILDYPWSSYLTCISVKPTKLKRETVIGWFDDVANFKVLHDKNINFYEMNKFLDI